MTTAGSPPLILLTNDDGAGHPGLAALAAAMGKIGPTVTIAPEQDNSAASHSLTMHRPLRVTRTNGRVYTVNGTPTDCVTVGVGKILEQKPTLVVSGINPGANLGDDVNYSGTVAAAVEGAMLGIPSLAVSIAGQKPFRFETAATVAARLAQRVLAEGLPRDTVLNINVPNLALTEIKGLRFTRQGRRTYDSAIKQVFDPWGREHFWIGGGTPIWDEAADTDSQALIDGFISATPIHFDLTNHRALAALQKKWQGIELDPLPFE